MNRYQGTYAAINDPPAGARPARDTGVTVTARGALGIVIRQRDAAEAALATVETERLRLIGQVADWKAEADRLQRIAVARSEESDIFERERDTALQERDHLREVIEFVLSEHHLGYCTLRADTLTILTAARGCLKKEEEEGPSLMNETVGE